MKVAEIVLSGGMIGTTEVEERQDLYRFTLKGREREREKERWGCEFMQVRSTIYKISQPPDKIKHWMADFDASAL